MYKSLEKTGMELVSCKTARARPPLTPWNAYVMANLAAAPAYMQDMLINAASTVGPALADFACYLFINVSCFLTGTSVSDLPRHVIRDAFNIYFEQLYDVAAYPIMVLLPFAVFAAVRRIPMREAAGAGKARVQVYAAAIGCALGLSVASGYLGALMDSMLASFGVYEPYYAGTVPFDVVSFILQIVSMCVLPAFIEEYCFRGVTFAEISYTSGTTAAIILSSLIFAIVHHSVITFPSALIFGLLAGWLRGRYDSIGPCIAAHFTVNLVSVMFEIGGEYLQPATFYALSAMFDIFAAAAFIFSVCYFIASTNKAGFTANFKRGIMPTATGVAYGLISISFIGVVWVAINTIRFILLPL